MSKIYQAGLYFDDMEDMQKCDLIFEERERHGLAIGEHKRRVFAIGVPQLGVT